MKTLKYDKSLHIRHQSADNKNSKPNLSSQHPTQWHTYFKNMESAPQNLGAQTFNLPGFCQSYIAINQKLQKRSNVCIIITLLY